MGAKQNSKSFSYSGSKKKLAIVLVIFAIVIFGPLLWFQYENRQFDKVFNNVAQSDWQEIQREEFGNRTCNLSCLGESRSYNAVINKNNFLNEASKYIQAEGFTVKDRDSSCGDTPKNDQTTTICSVSGEKDSLYLSLSINKNKGNPLLKDQYISIHFGHNSYLWYKE